MLWALCVKFWCVAGRRVSRRPGRPRSSVFSGCVLSLLLPWCSITPCPCGPTLRAGLPPRGLWASRVLPVSWTLTYELYFYLLFFGLLWFPERIRGRVLILLGAMVWVCVADRVRR